MEAIDRLRTMIGNVYRYEGVGRMTVHDVIESESFGILKTDTGDIKISLADIDQELEYFVLLNTNGLVKNPTLLDMVVQSNSMYATLQNTLLDTIQKIEKDDKYIPKAEAINETVKSIIDLEKVKVQTLQLLK
ncbi:hypothetical protein GGR21_002488 [Dysgonomonas hofstadii]|uniref:Uncharacterized protein n=1 Tax=Dysgonomonas hofstadii TaxID=637886 RepID=A0A840CVT0_9BACT|nr:hypothetical protein [Dysgonomonas hofstadii]MBB4036582.1 hypothetical protein [Dysgonomonas hofstadii]